MGGDKRSDSREKKKPRRELAKAPATPSAASAVPVASPPTAATRGGAASCSSSSRNAANLNRGIMLFAGTYHSVLAGLVYRRNNNNEDKLLLKFSVKHHIGCINAVATCGKYIASAGADEKIYLFTHKEHFSTILDLGSLAPASEVRVMRFPDQHFLVCGCEDGTVAAYKTRTWDCVSVLPVHTKAIVDMALHPSGPMAVTIGADRMVALLDMERGKLITKTKVPRVVPHLVLFDADATHFVVFLPFEAWFYSTLEAKRRGSAAVTPQPPFEIHSAVFLPLGSAGAGGLLIGCEDAKFRFVSRAAVAAHFDAAGTAAADANTGAAIPFEEVEVTVLPENTLQQSAAAAAVPPATRKIAAHRSRIRAMQFCSGVLFSSDTDGVVCAWRVVAEGDGKQVSLHQLCGSRCGGRITTLAAVLR